MPKFNKTEEYTKRRVARKYFSANSEDSDESPVQQKKKTKLFSLENNLLNKTPHATKFKKAAKKKTLRKSNAYAALPKINDISDQENESMEETLLKEISAKISNRNGKTLINRAIEKENSVENSFTDGEQFFENLDPKSPFKLHIKGRSRKSISSNFQKKENILNRGGNDDVDHDERVIGDKSSSNIAEKEEDNKRRSTFELKNSTLNCILPDIDQELFNEKEQLLNSHQSRESPPQTIRQKKKSILMGVSFINNSHNKINTTSGKISLRNSTSNKSKLRNSLSSTLDETSEKGATENDVGKKEGTFELEKSTVDCKLLPDVSESACTLYRPTRKQNSTFELDSPSVLGTPTISRTSKKSISQPASSSTPFIKSANKTGILKSILKKSTQLTLVESAIKTNPPIARVSTKKKIKIPNFALIHQRAFDRMESLDEHLKRRDERAKFLMSGQKTVCESPSKNPELNVNCKSKKQLQFPEASSTTMNSSISQNIPHLPRAAGYTPKKINPIVNKSISQPCEKDHLTNKPKFPSNSPFERQLSKDNPINTKRDCTTPKQINSKLPSQVCSTSNILKGKPITPYKSNFNSNKENIESPLKLNPADKQNRMVNISKQAKKTVTTFGFKVKDPKVVDKKEIVKAVANKTRVEKNQVDQRRNVIKGVRSNRRFDLLMKMRNK